MWELDVQKEKPKWEDLRPLPFLRWFGKVLEMKNHKLHPPQAYQIEICIVLVSQNSPSWFKYT